MQPHDDPRPHVLDVLARMLETGDPASMIEQLAPGAVVWHNNDKLEVDAAENMRRASGLHALVADVRVAMLQRERLSDGWLQRFVIHGTVRASGLPLAAHNCLIMHLDDDDRVTRIEEYLDPTFAAQLTAPAPAR